MARAPAVVRWSSRLTVLPGIRRRRQAHMAGKRHAERARGAVTHSHGHLGDAAALAPEKVLRQGHSPTEEYYSIGATTTCAPEALEEYGAREPASCASPATVQAAVGISCILRKATLKRSSPSPRRRPVTARGRPWSAAPRSA